MTAVILTHTDKAMAKQKPAADQPAPKEAENISSLELKLDDPAPPVETPEPAAKAEPEPVVETPVVGADEPSLLPSAVSLARQRGYEVSDDATDEDFWSHLETVEGQAAKAAEHERELAVLRQQLAERQAPTLAPEPKPAAGAATEPAVVDTGIPERPAIDKFTMQVMRFAQANGKLSEVGGYVTSDDPTLKPHVDAYNKYLADASDYDAEWTPRKIAEHTYAQKAAEDKAERETLRKELDALKTQQATSAVQGAIDGYFHEHKAAYFDLGEDGKPVWDAAKNEWRGQRYEQYLAACQRAVDLGIPTTEKIHEYAVEKVPPTVAAPAALPTPTQKISKIAYRLKNNGTDLIPTAPVSRPAATAATRSQNGLTFNQKLSNHFSDLMAEKVADRM